MVWLAQVSIAALWRLVMLAAYGENVQYLMMQLKTL